jgi:hexosaminidase
MRTRIVGFVLGLSALSVFAATPQLVPRPQQMTLSSGTFTLCPSQPILGAPAQAVTKILVDGASLENGQYLASLLLKSTGYRFQIATNSGALAVKRAILLTTVNALTNLGNEGYELTVAPDSVVIRATNSSGVFYGIQSLLQCLPPEIFGPRPVKGVAWTIPCLDIVDAPRFAWRGWMLDSVRHFFNKDEVKQLLDAMALNKLNTFHWHLDDDSGWRIQILQYPLLTDLGAWRTEIMFGLNNRSSTAFDDNQRYGGYYTQNDIREIVAYATQRHITVVPEIEMPGHSTAALSAYPEYSCNGTNNDCPTCFNVPHSLNNTSYSGGVFCAARPESFTFLTNVLKEVMGLFPGPYIHIGGDEVSFGNWNKHALDQALTNSLGLTNSPGISAMQKYQSYFTQKIANFVKSQGKTMIGWSEIMNGGTVTNAALMDWIDGSGSRAIQAATNGEKVVLTSSAELYLNKWQTGSSAGNGSGVIWSNEPMGQSGYVPLSTVYNFEPVPAALITTNNDFTNNIIGVQGNSWAEYIPSLRNMEFKTFPRLCAVAETDWTPKNLKSLSSFTSRLVVHGQRLAQMGINYNHETTPPAAGSWTPAQISTNFTPLVWDITTNVVFISTNLPSSGEIDVSFCWKSGTNGLNISWAALEENGIELDRDTHDGTTFTGTGQTIKPAYVLRLRSLRPGATYTLRASVAGRGGISSTGIVYLPNWD